MGDRQRKGLFGLISSGIGMAAEYNEHRKEQKQARAAAAEEQTSLPTADSTRSVEAAPTDLPPAYADATRSSDRTLEAGPSASDEKRRSVGPNDLTDPESFSSDDESTEDDEEMWELDDAITPEDSKDGLPSYEESEATKQLEPTEDLVRDVMGTSAAHKVVQPSSSRPQNPLPCPVIIPQRRPRKKSRGFVRAYAPVLQNAGIDQDTFLAFLKNFHKSSQAHPILPIIQVAAGIAGFAPGVIAMAVTTGVQIGAKVAAETQERYKTNTFLDKMNQELFQPAGLYAMIVKYKSDAEMEESARRTGLISSLIKPQTVDLSTNQVIAKYSGEDSNGGMSSRMQNLRLSSTTSSGQLSLPECAPLIFPAIDQKYSSTTGPETFKDKTKDAQRFLSDYLDRRAQMQYASQGSNPEQLTVPQGERGFRSSLADPNHAMHSGGLVALVSGGKLTPGRDKRERKMERREEKSARREDRREERRERREGGRRSRHHRHEYDHGYGDEFGHGRGGFGRGRGGFGRGRGGFDSFGRGRGGFGAFEGRGFGSNAGYDDHYRRRGLDDEAEYGDDVAGPSSSSRPDAYERRSRRGRRDRGQRGGGGPIRTVKRGMREDVLYLMIVNMPSDAELAEARDELARAKGRA